MNVFAISKPNKVKEKYMTKKNIKKLIIKCLEEINIYIDDFSENEELSNYIIDSFQFISFLVSIENIFEIEIKDEELLYENFATFKDVILFIENEKSK